MMKRIIPFTLALLLLFCGCAQQDRAGRPDDPDDGLYEKIDELDSNVSGGVIPIHTPDDEPSKSDGGEPSKDETAPPEDASEPETDALPEEPDHAAQVPIYPVDGDENFGSDHTPQEPGAMPDDANGEGDETDASQDGEEPGESEEPEPDSGAAPVTVTTYAMNTVYENDGGESILELRIGTPVIETKVSEAELLFNRYYSTKALEYALYVNETLFPEVKALQTGAEPSISSAEMAYSVLYNDDGYLCVLTSYTEALTERFEERAEAALFDMSAAVLLDEWEVHEASDASLETILERIAAVPAEPEEDQAAE